jgi:hypothetical protein
MTLAALICAYQEAALPEEGLRATLPLAGRTVVERQARLAAAAGALPVVLFVERAPPELIAAAERLRAEGVPVTLARTALEAAEAIPSNARLLLMADGFIADEVHVNRLVGESSGILTIPDLGVDDRFERIDAHSRWAGLALLNRAMLHDISTLIQDWDLQSTLLRRAVQSGVREFSVRGELADAHLNIVVTRADLAELERHIVEGAVARRDSWVSRYLLAPAEQFVTKMLMPTRVSSEWLRVLAVLLSAGAAFLFTRGWLWTGGILLLFSTPLDDVADRLAALRMQAASGVGSWWTYLLPASASAALLTLSWSLGGMYGWGCLPLAAATLAFMAALWIEIGDRDIDGQIFLAERKGMIWLMLPFALTGSWLGGLFGLTVYSAASFFWAQHQIHQRRRP